MDPNARRNTWDVVLKFRKHCAVLLSTHHLDEADLLSDRCAIIAQGRLQCNGTPLDLKRMYGAGYRLVMSLLERCDHGAVAAAVRQFVPNAVLSDESINEMAFTIKPADIGKFEPLLTHVEAHREALGVQSYGVSATTLEEVFLAVLSKSTADRRDDVAPLADHAPQTSSASLESKLDPVNDALAPGSAKLTAEPDDTDGTDDADDSQALIEVGQSRFISEHDHRALYWQRFKALFLRRYQYTHRDQKAFLSQIVLPVGFICLAMVVASLFPPVRSDPPLVLTPSVFDQSCSGNEINDVPFAVNDSRSSASTVMQYTVASPASHVTYLNLSMDPAYTDPLGVCGAACAIPFNISSYLLDTYTTLDFTRHIAFGMYSGIDDPVVELGNYEAPPPVLGQTLVAMHDTRSDHGLPIALNVANTGLYRRAMNRSDVSITIVSYPMNSTLSQTLQQFQRGGTDLTVAIFAIAALSFIPASFLVFLVAERVTKV